MSDRSDSGGFKFPWQALLGLIALVNVFWQDKPVTSPRPEPEKFEDPVPARVRVRMWEDPIDAIATRKSPSNVITNGPANIEVDAASSSNFLGLAVMVSGRPYAHAAESRIRSRVAVHHALSAEGFVPASEDYLRYAMATNQTLQADAAIAYELFRRDPGGRNSNAAREVVAVLWVSDDFIGSRQPLVDLQEMLKKLMPGKAGPTNRWKWSLIGPRYSSVLAALYTAAANRSATNLVWKTDSFERLEVFSPFATMDDFTIQKLAGVTSPAEVQMNTPIISFEASNNPACGFSFRQIGAQDDKLAMKIIEEMVVRNFDLTGESGRTNHIVFCGEQDSAYARALPQTFLRVLSGLGVEKKEVSYSLLLWMDRGVRQMATATRFPNTIQLCTNSRTSTKTDVAPEFHHINYFAGLDGAIGSEKKATSPGDSGSQLEKPEGRAQADYIFRQAQEIDSQVKRVRAVCLFSGDVYDKLVMLQVLRKVWPDATYFVTDADARYLSPENNRAARNVIIASAMGLQPPVLTNVAGVAEQPPVFRDTYQSTLYCAIREAVAAPAFCAGKTPVQLFEVGRNNLIALGSATNMQSLWRRTLSEMDITPGVASRTNWCLLGFAFVLILAVFWRFLQRRPHNLRKGGDDTFGFALTRWIYGRLSSGRVHHIATFLMLTIVTIYGILLAQNASPTIVLMATAALVLVLIERRTMAYVITAGAIAVFAFLMLDWAITSVMSGSTSRVQEPWSPNEGVSIWPAVITRMLAGVLCVLVLLREATHRFWRSRREEAKPEATGKGSFIRGVFPLSWTSDIEAHQDNSRAAYEAHAGVLKRLIRVVLLAFAYAIMMKCVFALWGMGHMSGPARGAEAIVAMRWSFVFSQFALFLLLAHIVDERKLLIDYSYLLMNRLRRDFPLDKLPDPEKMDPTARKKHGEDLAEYRDEILFIGERSSGTAVYWAFVAILLHWVGRLEYWDNWNWSPALGLTYALNVGVLLWASLRLQRMALALRSAVMHRLEPVVKPPPTSAPVLWNDIINCDKGAFAPLHRQPIVGALMVALGGLGSVDLVTKIALMMTR